MSDERIDRHPTDEPDGTPAYEASLRAPGAPEEDGDDDAGTASRANYDTDAVSGDSEVYRPD